MFSTLCQILYLCFLHYAKFYTYVFYTMANFTPTFSTLYQILYLCFLHYDKVYTYVFYTVINFTRFLHYAKFYTFSTLCQILHLCFLHYDKFYTYAFYTVINFTPMFSTLCQIYTFSTLCQVLHLCFLHYDEFYTYVFYTLWGKMFIHYSILILLIKVRGRGSPQVSPGFPRRRQPTVSERWRQHNKQILIEFCKENIQQFKKYNYQVCCLCAKDLSFYHKLWFSNPYIFLDISNYELW